ncbi:MAG: SAM-dependent methyltransferase [Rickettsiaceae bacterium]|nr:MAG: SAM-dependent methyltransferase [Rickettsiaceae bacterium]
MSIDSNIREYIAKFGFIKIDELMHQALAMNESSYYRHQKFIGSQGDFITAPEISQLFGEIIGLWCIDNWYKLNCPKNINLVELGPGRGILMSDILRIAKLVPEFYNSLNIVLVEINLEFIKQQKANLSKFKLGIQWVDGISKIPSYPTIFIANEFFDAMPIKQFIRASKNSWQEQVLVINKHNQLQYDTIDISLEQEDHLSIKYPKAHIGNIVEQSLVAEKILRSIIEQIKNYNGGFLIIDYGYYIEPSRRTNQQFRSTLQAVKDHKYQSQFINLGKADLSAHVDFFNLETIILRNLINCNYTSQREFLIKNGILIREAQLKKTTSTAIFQIIEKQVSRLISTEQMGALFKVLHSL